MQLLHFLLFAAGWYPLWRAWQATRGTALFHAVHWAGAAWLSWSLPLLGLSAGHPDPAVYLALCLTGCAGIAVFGARRPVVTAWNFVVLGLLAVMLLPLIEQAVIGARSLDLLRVSFLAVTLGLTVLNYLPTRLGFAAFFVGLACAGEMIAIVSQEPLPPGPEAAALRLCLLAAPWLALASLALGTAPDDLDQRWRRFRDAWGVVWAQRVREQFNRSAANAGWPVTLAWHSFVFGAGATDEVRHNVKQTLAALLKRFDQGPAAEL